MPYRENGYNPFGDGSDGALHVMSAVFMDKDIYNFSSLEIDNGANLIARLSPYECVIRCKTSVILNGGIICQALAGMYSTGGAWVECTRNHAGVFEGWIPGAIGMYYHQAADIVAEDVFTTPGGGGDTEKCLCMQQYGVNHVKVDWNGTFYVIATTNGDSIVVPGFPLPDHVGPGKENRFAMGCGGGGTSTGPYPGGNGGKAIKIIAPSIVFGAGGVIDASGGDGTDNALSTPVGGITAGGGGASITLMTRAPLSGTYAYATAPGTQTQTGDYAKCLCDGGLPGGASAGYGMNGCIIAVHV